MAFKPGQSGNPSGRPKAVQAITELAREMGPDCIKVLARIVLESEDKRTQIEAAKVLLDRGFGKAVQSIEHMGEGGGPVVIVTGVPRSA